MRCGRCTLVQFMTRSGDCRKCGEPLYLKDATPIAAPAETPKRQLPAPVPAGPLAQRLQQLRVQRHMSQKELALRMGIPRTYISKIENGKAQPTIYSLERIAAALDVTLAEIVAEGPAAELLCAMRRSPFLAELATFLPRLNTAALESVLVAARNLAARNMGRAA